ncbi:serine hydrolase domain-containing protein [Roseibium sp.]|uniref:serine hydrolase domain-containing protein n=1 Tax=Roseibium sp. TaxID=1936156 RepID=UPI003D0EFF2A
MRVLAISGLAAGALGAGLAVAYATGVMQLVWSGYPPAVWPASGAYEIVEGAAPPVEKATPSGVLNPRGQELFNRSGSRALLAARSGETELAIYADGYGADTRFNSFSLVKSLVGVLVLKAQSDGKIKSLDDPLGTYLPDLGPDSLRRVTIRAFLEMRSGLDFEPDGSAKEDKLAAINPFGNLAKLHGGGLSAVEDRLEVVPESRGEFAYQNVNTAILGRLLSTLYGKPLREILSEEIWRPSGAADAFWLRHEDGTEVPAYCCLFATPEDWIRVGGYLMRNGSPADPFLRPDLWQDFFGKAHGRRELAKGVYGLHVRHDILDRQGEVLQGPFTYMMGQGGQVVYMMPEKDLVVVRFGEEHALLHSTLYALWNSFPDATDQN